MKLLDRLSGREARLLSEQLREVEAERDCLHEWLSQERERTASTLKSLRECSQKIVKLEAELERLVPRRNVRWVI